MGSWFPARQVLVFRMGKVKHHHTFCGCAAAPNNQIGCEFMDAGTGGGDDGRRHWLVTPIREVARNQLDASRIALLMASRALLRRGLWLGCIRRRRQVNGLVYLERVQPLWTEFTPHAALLDPAEGGDRVIDVVVDPDCA